MSPMGLRSEKGCAGDAQQKPKSTDPTSRQRLGLIFTEEFLSNDNGKQTRRPMGGTYQVHR
jgi:hypothetical protein